MATDKYSNIGKGGIVKEGIFVRFPDLIPACPENWGNSNLHRKLMIVGESNYFNDNVDSVFKDPEVWYQGEITKPLIPNEEMKRNVSNYKSGYPPFDRLRDSMKTVLKIEFDNIFDEAIYYNYFLRPATGGRSFRYYCKPIDREVAGTALCGILEIVKPDIVIFASKYAYSEFQKYIDSRKYPIGELKIDFVYHPSRHFSWHHRNGNGKQKFEKLLMDYWIVK